MSILPPSTGSRYSTVPLDHNPAVLAKWHVIIEFEAMVSFARIMSSEEKEEAYWRPWLVVISSVGFAIATCIKEKEICPGGPAGTGCDGMEV